MSELAPELVVVEEEVWVLALRLPVAQSDGPAFPGSHLIFPQTNYLFSNGASYTFFLKLHQAILQDYNNMHTAYYYIIPTN